MNRGRTPNAVLCALLVAACARSTPPSDKAPAPAASAVALPQSTRPDVTTMDAATALKALDEATKELDDTLGAAAPDCGAVKVLRDRICALADRICQLAEATPGSELTARCQDAKPRCERAKARVAGPCG